jgi:DnaJ-class molecular chaperone
MSGYYDDEEEKWSAIACDRCGGMGELHEGTGAQECPTCRGNGAKMIGDVIVNVRLRDRLERFRDRGE